MVRVISISLALILSHFISHAQVNSYYVVIGSFAVESNAKRLVHRAHELNIPATYALHREHKLFYVFVRDTNSKGDAYETLLSMQGEGFPDAWVYKGWLNSSIVLKSRSDRDALPADSTLYRVQEKTLNDSETEVKPIGDKGNVTEALENTSAKKFVFNVVNASTGKSVKGQVHLLESQRSQEYDAIAANEASGIAKPKNKNGRWHIACYVVGYRPTKSSFVYESPEKTPGVVVEEGKVVIPLELERVQKGDYIEMDNVKFFPNSSLFTPDSERELTELVAMMEENEDYKIKVHGHTNGQPQGEIIARGNGVNFFSMEQENVHAPPSAKQLSTWRAEAVKEFLITKGIDPSRISTKGEGDKQPIFDPKGRYASGNDRVEVEITKS